MEKSEKLGLTGLLVLSMCIWGASWSSAKVLSGYASASTITFIRFIIIPLVLFPFLKAKGIPLGLKREGWMFVLGAGALMAVYTLLFFSGLQRGLPGAGGVLVTTSIPIFASILGLLINRRIPRLREQIGLVMGLFAGGLLLQIGERLEGIFSGGNLYFLFGALVYAGMSKITALAPRFGHPIAFNAWLHSVALVGLAFTTDFDEVGTLFSQADPKFWGNVIYFGVVNSSFATTTYFFATAKLGAERASTFMFIVPSAAVFFSWLILGEALLISTALGGIIAVIAVLMINGQLAFFQRK